jgi:hypothetical protein
MDRKSEKIMPKVVADFRSAALARRRALAIRLTGALSAGLRGAQAVRVVGGAAGLWRAQLAGKGVEIAPHRIGGASGGQHGKPTKGDHDADHGGGFHPKILIGLKQC